MMKWQSPPSLQFSFLSSFLKACFISMARLCAGRGRHLCNWLKAAGEGEPLLKHSAAHIPIHARRNTLHKSNQRKLF